MAKKKRKRAKKENTEITTELYAVVLVIAAILGIGKLGIVGRLIASFGLFLTGSIYIVFLLSLFIIGIYAFIKREWPDFLSTKMFGIYLFVIGLLSFMHWEFVSQNNGNASLIFRETMNQLVKGFNSIVSSGTIAESISVGGGFIGGIFALAFT